MNKKFAQAQAGLAHSQKLADIVNKLKQAPPGSPVYQMFMQELQQMMLQQAAAPEAQQAGAEQHAVGMGQAKLAPPPGSPAMQPTLQ